ncbi:Na+/H+ antiporter NhaA, partial [Francisella tularensis]|uniref:Na+/H+ antiporter NhaA n=1 Tax=Francisella tularensis TaxID=263 RepID=UPI002381C169
ISLLCGIGFTMSIFIVVLDINDNHLLNAIKIFVVVGSVLSGFFGYIVLRFIVTNPS